MEVQYQQKKVKHMRHVHLNNFYGFCACVTDVAKNAGVWQWPTIKRRDCAARHKLCVYSRHGRRNTAARQGRDGTTAHHWPRWEAQVCVVHCRSAVMASRHPTCGTHSRPVARYFCCDVWLHPAQHRAMTATAGQEPGGSHFSPWACYLVLATARGEL